MFPAGFFGPRFFPARYWPKPLPPPVTGSQPAGTGSLRPRWGIGSLPRRWLTSSAPPRPGVGTIRHR